MPVVIRQPAGLGDILFCQKIAYEIEAHDQRVIWPVIPQYSWIGDYLPLYEYPVDYKMQRNDTEMILNQALPGFGIMQAKYEIAGVDMKDWQKYIHIERNHEKERVLFSAAPPEYNLVCMNFASPPQVQRAPFIPLNDLPTIDIRIIEGFTPFDWMTLIQHATELHFVDTCFTYLCELMPLAARRMCLYPRIGSDSTIQTKGLWSKPWEYME
jgi:hypothetical protein